MAFAPDPRLPRAVAVQLRDQTLTALEEAVRLRTHATRLRTDGATLAYTDTNRRALLALGRAFGLLQAFSGDHDSPGSTLGMVDSQVRELADSLEVSGTHPRAELERMVLSP